MPAKDLRTRVVRWFARVMRVVQKSSTRMYASAQPNRLNQGFPSFNTSADAELVTSLRNLRSRSRQLVRDAAYAKNAKRIVVNNVVGTGIKLQAAVMTVRNTFNDRVNDGIEEAFAKWSSPDSCHTGGTVHFHDLERICMGEVFEAGEIFIRIHRRKFGDSEVPLALEIVEPERIVDGYAQPGQLGERTNIRMGIELDDFMRPVAYWVRDLHPGDIRMNLPKTEQIERVLATDMIHLKLTDRWPQTRGEPWMHAVSRKMADMDGYSEAEIIAARGAANYMGTIKTPEASSTLGEEQQDGSYQMGLEPGSWMKLLPGEEANLWAPNRPNSALDPFMRFMLREVAAGIGVSYESLSRDYSQSNYSSSRLALLDDRDVWRSLQQWFVRTFRARLHKEWMNAAMIARAISELSLVEYGQDIEKYQCAIFRPRGWSWVDPTKEVAAFKEAIKAGLTTNEAVIAQTGGGDDLEDIMNARAAELKYMKELNLVFDTSPEVYVAAETRGQMIIGPDGNVEAAAQAVAAPDGADLPAKPTSAPASSPDEEPEEPSAAESGDRSRLRRVATRILRFPRRG